MNFARHSISETKPVHIFDARFDSDCQLFTTSTPAGFAVYRACPLTLLRKRELKGGNLSLVLPLHTSSLLFLVGGGRSPLYPPNKVILWDEATGSEVAELEFRERVRGLACRRGWLSVALRRRVVVFQIGEQLNRFGEWDTCENIRGLVAMATAPYSTLLAIPGRQMGHVQLIHLPQCKPPKPRGPPPSSLPLKPPAPPTKHPVSIIVAHQSGLTTLALPPSGRLIATTSSRGTLVRVWDTFSGKLLRELRRGTDKADIFGVAFRPDEKELCVWSDKGTVHVFNISGRGAPGSSSNRQSTLSNLTPFLKLPKYFESEWSYAQYRIPHQSAHISMSSAAARSPAGDIPDEERCVVGWIDDPATVETGTSSNNNPPRYQLIALTYTGGWYRLSLPGTTLDPSHNASPNTTPSSPPRPSSSVPRHRTSSVSSMSTRTGVDKGKDRERDRESKPSSECTLLEFRRFGRWDGWG